jgi:hypothetical protein
LDSQHTHPYFILKNVYRDYGLDTLLNKFSYGRKNKSELYDNNSLLLYIGKSAFEDEKFEDALRIFQFNHKEFPDNKETMDIILIIEKLLNNTIYN